MRISRIHTPAPLAANSQITLNEKISHYLLKVLRLTTGSQLILFNGDGHQYLCELISADKKTATVQTLEQSEKEQEPALNIHLGIGLSKGDRLDFAFQKATELGASQITPLFTEFSTLKLNKERMQKKQEHWNGIIGSACEQSGRCYLPTLYQPSSIDNWIQENHDGLKIVLSPHESRRLDTFNTPEKLTILIGPEGGLSDSEVRTAISHGFAAVRLGRHVLRTETAPLAVIAAAQVLWGDFKN